MLPTLRIPAFVPVFTCRWAMVSVASESFFGVRGFMVTSWARGGLHWRCHPVGPPRAWGFSRSYPGATCVACVALPAGSEQAEPRVQLGEAAAAHLEGGPV